MLNAYQNLISYSGIALKFKQKDHNKSFCVEKQLSHSVPFDEKTKCNLYVFTPHPQRCSTNNL